MEYTLAKLYTGRGDIKKVWYAYFKYRNDEGKMQLIKKKAGINRFHSLKERKREGELLTNEINNLLLDGWNPFKTVEEQQTDFSKLTLIEMMNEIKKTKESTLRKKSIQHYKHAIDIVTGFLKSTNTQFIYPTQFTPLMAQAYSDYLLTTKNYKGKSHNNQMTYMKGFFSQMIDREIVTKNPFKNIKNRPVDIGSNKAFTDKERETIKNYLERNKHPLFIFVQFLYYCGIRPNELMQLQVRHIDFEQKQIQIPAHISKNRKQSSVELPNTFYQLVKKHYQKLNPELYLFARGLVPGTIPIHRNRATLAHKKVLDDLKITNDHTLYSWKHTGAIAAIKSGMNPYSLMRQWRHHSLDQTMIYLKTLGLSPNTEFATKQPKF